MNKKCSELVLLGAIVSGAFAAPAAASASDLPVKGLNLSTATGNVNPAALAGVPVKVAVIHMNDDDWFGNHNHDNEDSRPRQKFVGEGSFKV